jgi:hypothetical protein
MTNILGHIDILQQADLIRALGLLKAHDMVIHFSSIAHQHNWLWDGQSPQRSYLWTNWTITPLIGKYEIPIICVVVYAN